MMAAPSPAMFEHRQQQQPNWITSTDSTEGDKEPISSLAVGMSGMRLVHNENEGRSHERKATDSTMSSSPDEDTSRNLSSKRSSSAPVSPVVTAYEKQMIEPRPSVGTIPSPITKPGPQSKNTSATSTSPSVSLTPNSNDGSFLPSFQGIPGYTEGPNVPFLATAHRRVESGSTFGGSVDLSHATTVSTTIDQSDNHSAQNDSDNDGLLGLDALRDRAYHHHHIHPASEPSTSPRMFRSTFGRSSDRPPLSHSYTEVDHRSATISLPSINVAGNVSSSRSVGGGTVSSATAADTSFESNESSLRGFGAIGPAGFKYSDYDSSSRQRASSQDNPFTSGYPEVSQKFGTLPTLGSHLQQQQKQPHLSSEVPKPKHIRSVSQPGIQQQESKFYGQYFGDDQSNHSYKSLPGTRSTSISHPVSSAECGAYEQSFSSGKTPGISMPNLRQSYSSGAGGVGYPPLERREAAEYQQYRSMSGTPPSFISAESSTGYLGGGSHGGVSPIQSPHQMYYSSGSQHFRQQSESGLVLGAHSLSSGLASSFQYQRQHHHQYQLSQDDDLVGEHIEVPDQHEEMIHSHSHHGMTPYYIQGTAASTSSGQHPLLRGHAHSMSLDGLQYDHRPTVGAALPMPKVVYSVKFKRSQRNFVLGPRISRDLKIGTYVKVEADRGEDLGIVVGKMPAEKYNSYSGRASFTAGMGPPNSLGGSLTDLKHIIRLATHDEVSLLGMKREEEEELLQICRTKVRQRGLPMNVVDAEYQFDRHKLTFFFEAEGRVDFRELVRDLFSMYKTRIWMQQLDKNTSTSAQAIVAPQVTADLQMDYGTPIIAPASEFADSIVFNVMPEGR